MYVHYYFYFVSLDMSIFVHLYVMLIKAFCDSSSLERPEVKARIQKSDHVKIQISLMYVFYMIFYMYQKMKTS